MSSASTSGGSPAAGSRAGTPVLAVVGPTAVGKSALADALAERLDGEVVSADSMQVYRGMDVGTAKTPPELRRVRHHCIDLVDPGSAFSAALYQRRARAAIGDISGRGRLPVLAGGTGLYVRAALDDWEFPPGERSGPLRERLEAEAAELGAEAMHERLAAIDPEAAELIPVANVRRTLRALEMADAGELYSARAARFADRRSLYDAFFLGVTMERERLYERIDARVDEMVSSGLVDEVRRLLDAGFRDALTSTQAIGYKEFVPVVEGHEPPADAVGAVKRATRRYAKRQLTWFRADPRVRWLDVTGLSSQQALSEALVLLQSWERRPGQGPAKED